MKFSELIRKLIFIYLSDKEEHKNWKKDILIFERKSVGKEIASLFNKRTQLDEELEKEGINPDDLI